MMFGKLWRRGGRVVFWLAWPALWVYLRIGSRSRLLLLSDDSILVLKGWLGLNKWQLPGGGIRRHETAVQGLVREVHEETGLVLNPKDLKSFHKGVAHYRGLKFKYHCFSLVIKPRPVVKKALFEITDMAWLPLKELTAKNATADTYQIVQAWLKR